MEAYFHVVFAPSGCRALDNVDGAAEQQTLHGDFDQVLCLMSKARDGAIITDQHNRVAATGQIVSCGESDPTDIKTAFLHFHAFGDTSQNDGAWSYLLLPVTRSGGAGKQFVCPINSKESMVSDQIKSEQSIVSVLAADKSNSIVVKEFDYNDPSSEYASDCLWFAETTAGALWRLYVTPNGGRRLYMAADGAGRMFLTADEPLSIQREGMENPATNFRLYLKYHAVEA